MRTNNIQLISIQTFAEDEHKINKAAALKDGNILLNLGVSDLNKELYKKAILFSFSDKMIFKGFEIPKYYVS